jgi:hypothetical protein
LQHARSSDLKQQQQQQQQMSQHPMPPSKHGSGQPFEKRSLILSPAEIYAEIVHHGKLASNPAASQPLCWTAQVAAGQLLVCDRCKWLHFETLKK